MSNRLPTVSASGKDANRQNVETKAVSTVPLVLAASVKPSGPGIKLIMSKSASKEQSKEMSPPDKEWELLGSLTTQQQQRTSARVIKKLKLEPRADGKKRSDGASDEIPECDTPNKISEELKFPVKQRMPKALWSTDEKNLFFEALNEYGKDFDSITSYICAKMKKKGQPDVNLKTKTQVSHFYYRTWHKLSKHVHFGENVKKVAQELYALINYGELRKKLVSVNEKTCGRLGEMVLGGSIVVRARGRNLRVRTPMCRALRRLNQITERACGSRVCARATVALRARDAASWARVQAAAHNPRLLVVVPPTASLRALIAALARRWQGIPGFKSEPFEDSTCHDAEQAETDDLLITEDGKTLHVGPRAGAEVHLPVVRPSAPLSSQNICFSSYLQRMAPARPPAKIRTTKRQRKDSMTEKDKEVDQKKARIEEDKLINIEETAIDGIELMASYKNSIEEGPSTEDEKEVKEEELRGTVEEDLEKEDKEFLKVREDIPRTEEGARDRDREMSEKEKDSFSEMEDDEKYNKSDTDNESDHGKGKERKFNNLKVKFRLRPKKRGGSIYTLVMDSDKEERSDNDKPDVDVELALRQIRAGWSARDAADLTVGDAYLMFGSRSRLELDYWWAEPSSPLPQKPRPEAPAKSEKTEKNEKTKPEKTERVEKNDKTKPDKAEKLDKSEKTDKTKVEKTEKTEKTLDKGTDSSVEDEKGGKESDTDIFSPKNTFSQDSNDGSGDERKGEQPWSPEHKGTTSSLKLVNKLVNRPRPYPPATDTGFTLLSERLKRLLSLAGNPLVPKPRCCGHECRGRGRAPPPPAPAHVFRPPAPIAPRPDHESTPPLDLADVPRVRRGRARVAERRVVVQRLLPLLPKLPPHTLLPVASNPPAPPRILPKPPPTSTSDLSFFYVLSESNGQFYFHDGDRRIPITQPNQESPVKSENSEEAEDGPDENKDLKTDLANDFTISSEALKSLATSGDIAKDFTISSEALKSLATSSDIAKDFTISSEALKSLATSSDIAKEVLPSEVLPSTSETGKGLAMSSDALACKKENANVKGETADTRNVEGKDVGGFLSQESMSLSPSRLLRDAEWLEGGVQDFSLSSFLGQLESRPHHERTVDSHVQSMMIETSVDYVAKFADLAAGVTGEVDPLATDDLT